MRPRIVGVELVHAVSICMTAGVYWPDMAFAHASERWAFVLDDRFPPPAGQVEAPVAQFLKRAEPAGIDDMLGVVAMSAKPQ